MSRTTTRLIALACAAACLASGVAHAQEAKNPLIKPKTAKLEVPVGTQTLPPPPVLQDKLPALSRGNSTDDVAKHLSQLRVVATVGSKAILRGPLGKSGNLALVSGQEAPLPGLGSVNTVATTSATTASADSGSQLSGSKTAYSSTSPATEAAAATRTLVLTSGLAVQLSDGVWVRPEVVGETVHLYVQTSSKDHSEALVYSSSVEIAGASSLKLVEGSYDSDKKADKGAAK